ncbi:MAG TPA: class I SAM-dependent methyltransferase [Gaiellaceae bacterium]|nr:class I SAM-dependent methyltransferase [Gaiellaceae bacterium]
MKLWRRRVAERPGMRGWTRFDRRDADQAELSRKFARSPMERLFYSHDGRSAAKWHHYLALYDRHVEPFRGTHVRLLELGVLHGGSLQLWRDYLGDQAVIHGIDIDERCATISEPGITVHVGDASDPTLLREVVREMGGIDILIDDASHLSEHQIAAFEAIWPLLADDGIYICEDLHASYWQALGGGYLETGSFIEYVKHLVDRLHVRYVDDERLDRDETFARQCRGIHIYDSMVVLEKDERRPEPFHTMVGRTQLPAAEP